MDEWGSVDGTSGRGVVRRVYFWRQGREYRYRRSGEHLKQDRYVCLIHVHRTPPPRDTTTTTDDYHDEDDDNNKSDIFSLLTPAVLSMALISSAMGSKRLIALLPASITISSSNRSSSH